MSGRKRSAPRQKFKRITPSRQPLAPGQPCPSRRSGKAIDPDVTDVVQVTTYSRTGTRTCRCGATTRVDQTTDQTGHPLNAWQYAAHLVPVKVKS